MVFACRSRGHARLQSERPPELIIVSTITCLSVEWHCIDYLSPITHGLLDTALVAPAARGALMGARHVGGRRGTTWSVHATGWARHRRIHVLPQDMCRHRCGLVWGKGAHMVRGADGRGYSTKPSTCRAWEGAHTVFTSRPWPTQATSTRASTHRCSFAGHPRRSGACIAKVPATAGPLVPRHGAYNAPDAPVARRPTHLGPSPKVTAAVGHAVAVGHAAVVARVAACLA
jgi:hypothetical protein